MNIRHLQLGIGIWLLLISGSLLAQQSRYPVPIPLEKSLHENNDLFFATPVSAEIGKGGVITYQLAHQKPISAGKVPTCLIGAAKLTMGSKYIFFTRKIANGCANIGDTYTRGLRVEKLGPTEIVAFSETSYLYPDFGNDVVRLTSKSIDDKAEYTVLTGVSLKAFIAYAEKM